jgi:hypothetical protein
VKYSTVSFIQFDQYGTARIQCSSGVSACVCVITIASYDPIRSADLIEVSPSQDKMGTHDDIVAIYTIYVYTVQYSTVRTNSTQRIIRQ